MKCQRNFSCLAWRVRIRCCQDADARTVVLRTLSSHLTPVMIQCALIANEFIKQLIVWLGGRKGIRPVKKLSGWMLAWLSVWGEMQICIWPSWCHCHSLSLAPVNPDWFYQNGSAFLVPAYPGCPGKKAVK